MEPPITHVLYISTTCNVCRGLRAKGIPYGVRVENVVDIIPLPAWLDGTPILVDVGVGVLYKGSDALLVLDHMRQNQAHAPPPVPIGPPMQQSHPHGPHGPPHGHPPGMQGPQGPPRPQSPQGPFQPDPPRREPIPQSAAGDVHQVDGPTNWDAMFSEPADEPPPPAGGRSQKFSESSISDMMTRRAQQTPPLAGLQVK